MSKENNISRREFVATAASAAALSALPSTNLFGADAPPHDRGIEDLTKSPYAKLRNVPVHAVNIGSGFWGARRAINVEKSILTMHDELASHGRMDNYLRLVGKSNAPQKGPVYSDSDIYKWLEAAGFALQSGDNPQLRRMCEEWIDGVVAVQEPGGYLNTYYVRERASQRMADDNQWRSHELYNAGHMLQCAIAYYRATGDRKLLDAGIRFVDDWLIPSYGLAPKKPAISGHPVMEMGLVELYRITGEKRHLDFAGYLLGGENRIPLTPDRSIYCFSGTPFTARTKLEGHAVRAMYACSGATDYYMETGDPTYWRTLNTLWDDMTSSKMYVTGGVGSRSDGEAFGDAYELPNATAYGESCAAIGNMMWSWRMLAATGDAKFADVIERALYNGINSGMSLDGTTYCYRNPLAFDPQFGEKIRNPWYDTTCCPPNLERTFASLPGYFYSTSKDGLYVHLYDNSEMNWRLENGVGLKVKQTSNYPWDGNIKMLISPAEPTVFTLFVRLPGWAEGAQVAVNGKAISGAKPGLYLPIQRRWAKGDTVQLQFPMTVRVIESNPQIVENTGRVAVQRGPLVYCLEELDQPSGVKIVDATLPAKQVSSSHFQADFEKGLLGGMTVLRCEGAVFERLERQPLYSQYRGANSKTRPAELKFIPYYAWANRQPSVMQVWMPILKA